MANTYGEEFGVVIFAFGVGGPANIALANYGEMVVCGQSDSNWLQDLPRPRFVYTQDDVSELLYGGSEFCIKKFYQGADGPPPTLRIARWAVKEAKKDGVTHLLVIAAKPHIKRCLRDMRFAMVESGEDLPFDEFMESPHAAIYCAPPSGQNWYSKESKQYRTQSSWKWWPREIILRLLPMWLYKRVAS